MAFYRLMPFGDDRADLRSALQTANLISPHLKKGHTPKLKDYMIDFEPKVPMSPDEIKNVLARIK